MKLRFVSIESFYDAHENLAACDLFGKVVALKIRGYLKEYDHGTLAVDTTDIFADHHMVCDEMPDGTLLPLMAYRSTRYSRCRIHNLPFPLLPTLQASGATTQARAVQAVLAEAQERRIEVSWDSSWTIDPETRKDRVLVQRLKEMFLTSHVLSHSSEPTISFVGGVLRLKTDQFFKRWGYEPLQLDGADIPTFFHAFLKNEEIRLMKAQTYSPYAVETAEKHRQEWENRIILGRSVAILDQRKIAA